MKLFGLRKPANNNITSLPSGARKVKRLTEFIKQLTVVTALILNSDVSTALEDLSQLIVALLFKHITRPLSSTCLPSNLVSTGALRTVMSASSLMAQSLKSYFPSLKLPALSEPDLIEISRTLFPSISYTDNEKVDIRQWGSCYTHFSSSDEDDAKHIERLGALNAHLSTHTTLVGSKPSAADVLLYTELARLVNKWSAEERTGERGYHHISRYVDFVENAPFFGLSMDEGKKVAIDPNHALFVPKPVDVKEEKQRKKKEKAAAKAGSGAPLVTGLSKEPKASESAAKHVATTQGADAAPKKEKKEKAPKQPKQSAAKETPPLSPSLIDLRVGHILKAENHPNADSLYVSTIVVGDPAGADHTFEYEGQVVRTVCSGLNGLIPLAEMQGRKVVAVCNLKPVTMRGIKSAAMVLAASPRPPPGEPEDGHATTVELVSPPADAAAGARVLFEGWEGEPEGQLNPKKKVWESCQVGFTTTEDLVVAFDKSQVEQLKGDGSRPAVGRLAVKGLGTCTVKSLQGATVR